VRLGITPKSFQESDFGSYRSNVTTSLHEARISSFRTAHSAKNWWAQWYKIHIPQ